MDLTSAEFISNFDASRIAKEKAITPAEGGPGTRYSNILTLSNGGV